MVCLFSHLFSCRAGSDGKEYQFLLKGHEDLRQDERVMQLFGLVNSLLRSNADTFRRNLTYVPCPLASGSLLLTVTPPFLCPAFSAEGLVTTVGSVFSWI